MNHYYVYPVSQPESVTNIRMFCEIQKKISLFIFLSDLTGYFSQRFRRNLQFFSSKKHI
jgi:hypothetical protein